MKIALIDLNHTTLGVHTNTVALGLGLISRYLKKTVGNRFDIKMFKDAEKALKTFESWIPDVLGLTQYSWNSQLNLYVSRIVKQINPDCLVVAGGPNLHLSKSRRSVFLMKDKSVDICIAYDGEIPFTEIVKRLLAGEPTEEIRRKPVAGSYSLDPESGNFVESLEYIPRLKSLDVFGAMYADGVFEELLNDGFHPFLQTHRGCPFTCEFCHTSDRYYSRMLFQSPEIFEQDMEYLGKRFAGQHNVTLYLANTNMSLFNEDFHVAHIIRKIQDKYDWPRLISVNSGKNPKKLLDMLSIIKFQPGIALQTLTPHVLENIRRKNIPFEDFVDFQRKVLQETGEVSATELILPLPGEAKDTFMETLKKVMNSGIQDIGIYTLMNLKGTPLSLEENANHYGYVIRHRVVPRQFSVVNGTKILDTEEVIVGTNSMPFKEYLELRGLSFIITVFFSSAELVPIKRLMLEYGIDIAQWIFNIHSQRQNFPNLCESYKAFLQEAEQELFPTRETLIEFFDKPKSFQALCSGQLGDNLLRKYNCIIRYRHYKAYLELAISEARKIISNYFKGEKADELVSDIKTYLLTRDIKKYYVDVDSNENRYLHLNHDIQGWLQKTNGNMRIEDFRGSYEYVVGVTDDSKRRFNEIFEMNKNFELSLQRLYRDGTIKNFWPVWTRK